MKYKHIISLGSNCEVAGGIILANMRDGAYPFDWMTTDLSFIISSFENDFADFNFNSTNDYKDSDIHKVFTNLSGDGHFYHECYYTDLDNKLLFLKNPNIWRKGYLF